MAAITKQLVQQADQWIARHRDEMVDEVCRLIRFPSVADPSGVPPYGQNCREVLDAYLRPLGIPVIYGFPAGHEDPNLSLYLGREVTVSVGTQGASLLFR